MQSSSPFLRRAHLFALAFVSALLPAVTLALTTVEGQILGPDGVTPVTNLKINGGPLTDANGRFSIPATTGTFLNLSGSYDPLDGALGVAAPQGFSGLSLYLSVPVEGTTVTLAAAKFPVFHPVTLVSVSGGTPIPGVNFTVVPAGTPNSGEHSLPGLSFSQQVVTNASGEALFQLAPGRHTLYLGGGDGYGWPTHSGFVTVYGPDRIEYEYGALSTVTGTVTLSDGTTPVEGVSVSAIDIGYTEFNWGPAVTNASGVYTLQAPPRPLRMRLARQTYAGAGLAQLDAPDFVITEPSTRAITSGSNTVNLSLPATGRLTGSMLANESTPVVGEFATVYTSARTSGGWSIGSWGSTKTTAAGGQFTADLPLGRARLILYPGSGYKDHRWLEEVTGGPFARSYSVYSSGSIQLSGRITDHLGNGLPLTVGNGHDNTTADSNGNWTLITTRGSFALSASFNGTFGPPIDVPEGGFTYRFRDVQVYTANTSALNVALPAPYRLSGTARVNGAAAPFASVQYRYDPDETPDGYFTTPSVDGSGAFSVERFAGPFELVAAASGPDDTYASSYTGNLTANASITFNLTPGPAYTGTVRGSVGGPGLPGVRLSGADLATSTAGGAYRLAVGHYSSVIYATDDAGWSAPVGTPEDFRTGYFRTLPGIQSDTVSDIILPFVSLTGTITRGGIPVSDGIIRASSTPNYDGVFASDSATVTAGGYELGLIDGVFTISIESTNSAFEARVLYGYEVSGNGTLNIELETLSDPVLYVDDTAAPGGDGVSLGTALTSLSAAISKAAAGTKIIIAPGTYVGGFTISKRLHLTSLDPNDPEVVRTTILSGTGTAAVVRFSGSATAQSIIEGFTIVNGGGSTGAGVFGDNQAVIVRNNIITRNRAAGANVFVIFPFSYTNGGSGAGVSNVAGAVVNNLITQNSAAGGTSFSSFNGTPAYGVGIANCSGIVAHNLLFGNTVTSGTSGALGASQISGAFYNNIVWGNGAGPQVSGLSNARHNLIADYPSTTDSFGNFSADPLFADADGPDNFANTWADNDFRMPLTSPVVDAGTDPTSVYTNFDMLGISRPRDFAALGFDNAPHLGFDIGPFEVASLDEQHNDPAGDSTHDYVGPRLLISYQGGSPSSTTVTLIPTNSLISNLTVGVAGTEIADAVWQIESDRTSFTATVTIRYLAAEIAGLSGSEANLRVYRASSLDGPWTELATVLDTTNNTATFTTTGFSVFTLAKEFEGTAVGDWILY